MIDVSTIINENLSKTLCRTANVNCSIKVSFLLTNNLNKKIVHKAFYKH